MKSRQQTGKSRHNGWASGPARSEENDWQMSSYSRPVLSRQMPSSVLSLNARMKFDFRLMPKQTWAPLNGGNPST